MATSTQQISLGSLFVAIRSLTLASPWVIVTANGFQAAVQQLPPVTWVVT